MLATCTTNSPVESLLYENKCVVLSTTGETKFLQPTRSSYVNPQMVKNIVWKRRVPKWFFFASSFPYNDLHMEMVNPNGEIFSFRDFVLNPQIFTDTVWKRVSE